MRVLKEIKEYRGNPLGQSIWGGLSFSYFSLATQRKVTRYQAEKILKRIDELLFNWIPTYAGMTVNVLNLIFGKNRKLID